MIEYMTPNTKTAKLIYDILKQKQKNEWSEGTVELCLAIHKLKQPSVSILLKTVV